MPTLFVVDEEAHNRDRLQRLFEQRFEVIATGDVRSATQILSGRKGKRLTPDVVLLDIRLPDGSGIELLERVRKVAPNATAIVMTRQADVDQAVEAMRRGASDYILKPFEMEEISLRIERALRSQERLSELYVLAKNRAMQRLYRDVESVAASPSATVLIRGETGVGKEHIAHRIHSLSQRNNGPFVDINVAALSPELLESELFGHEQGAFTGATRSKRGLVEVASGGTLFLDEIGDMELTLQAKIIRVLEERVLRRVGGTENIPVDIRLITATHRNLEALVAEGKFREDLYFRLNVVPLQVPPLRDRIEDIEALCHHFLKHLNVELGRHIEGLEEEALSVLCGYNWPGNVRELRNVLERAVLLECKGHRLSKEHLKLQESGIPSWTLCEVEAGHIRNVLAQTHGDRAEAARRLGITRATLTKKLRKYGMG